MGFALIESDIRISTRDFDFGFPDLDKPVVAVWTFDTELAPQKTLGKVTSVDVAPAVYNVSVQQPISRTGSCPAQR